MLDKIREERDRKVKSYLRYFSAIMGLFYLIAGFGLYFLDLPLSLDESIKTTASIILVAYGLFRIYRVFCK